MPRFTKSERGNPKLQHEHHEYNYREKQKKYHLWRCVNNKTIVGCNGTVGTASTTDEATQVVEIIHSIETTLFIDQLDSGCFKFFLNNLITNKFSVWNYVRYNVERCLSALFDLLITGRKQFKNITYYQLDPRLNERIIEVMIF
ncbi:unnamed protein product [Meloidogyne enterolobii]|uniref:Uncharacterized protein n=1 Tax=Meloidogyne enterolobii TaxID=390850 RepID=A0ACB1AZB7_MELEN